VYASSRKAKPVKADHQVFNSSKNINENHNTNATEMYSPK